MMDDRPAIVLAAFNDVDLVAALSFAFEAARAVLGLKQKIRARLPREALRISHAVRPDLWSHALFTYERIVLRDRAVVIEPQDLSGERIHLLREFPLCRVAVRDVELAVRTKS